MSKIFYKLFFPPGARLATVAWLLAVNPARAQMPGAGLPAKFLGAPSCASSSCHGGGGDRQNQYIVWSVRDFHSQRPVTTLATARARQIAEALQITDPTLNADCTTCHAPLQTVPAALRGPAFTVTEGVSCESCHGPAENWLRSHTRTDWTQADRVFAGLRDLQNLYVRANTCVACHQNVSQRLLHAGHPELIFEMDGQCAAEPRHWQETAAWNRAQSWLVGQAVALREMSWQLATEPSPDARLIARWRALVWLLQKLDGLAPALPGLQNVSASNNSENFLAAKSAADALARSASGLTWNDDLSRETLIRLAATAEDFANATDAGELPARRAERLVLALDRLILAQKSAAPAADQNLNQLFKLAQSAPDFDAAAFAGTLKQFADSLKGT